MKQNYLKPLCSVVPIHGLKLLAGSEALNIDGNRNTNTVLSREMIDEPAGVPTQNSLWDD